MELKESNLLKDLFIEKYPSVWQAIFDIKGGKYFADTYGNFARTLQWQEAEIIFDEVNIALIDIGIDAINIFDAIYVADKHHLEVATNLLHDAFNKRGLSPTLNYEGLSTLE